MVSKKVAEQIRYLEAKTKYERILREQRTLNEYSDGREFFSAIGGAFGDIFKTIKLSLMDLSNRIRFSVQKLVYSARTDEKGREKLKKAYDDYNRKHDKIYNEWAPLVQKNLKAITSFDPLVGLALMPGKYMATKSIEAGLKAGKNAAEIIGAEPWASMMRNTTDFGGFENIPGATPEETQQRQANASLLALNSMYEQLQDANNINARLASLFLSSKEKAQNESLISKKNLLSEQVQQERSAITDPEKWIDQVFDHTGIQNALDEIAIQLVSDNIALMQNIIPSMNSSVSMMQIMNTENFDDFENAIKKITSEKKVETEKIDELNDLLQQAKQKIVELLNEPKFKEALEAENKAAVSEEELAKIASNQVFNEVTSQIKKQFNDNLQILLPMVQSASEKLPKSINDPVVKDISSPIGKKKLGSLSDEFVKVYKEYSRIYDDFKKLRKQ